MRNKLVGYLKVLNILVKQFEVRNKQVEQMYVLDRVLDT